MDGIKFEIIEDGVAIVSLPAEVKMARIFFETHRVEIINENGHIKTAIAERPKRSPLEKIAHSI